MNFNNDESKWKILLDSKDIPHYPFHRGSGTRGDPVCAAKRIKRPVAQIFTKIARRFLCPL
jgi:hypothetical protein